MLQERDMNRVRVEILGESYTVKGDTAPGYIADVARLVDSRMRELNQSGRIQNKTRLAVLTALNLADELLQKKGESVSPEGDDLSTRTQQLITLLDEGLVGDIIE